MADDLYEGLNAQSTVYLPTWDLHIGPCQGRSYGSLVLGTRRAPRQRQNVTAEFFWDYQ